MKIGVAGPMTLDLLNYDWQDREVPKSYAFPLISNMINALLERGHEVVAYTTSTSVKKPMVFQNENLTICVARREPHAARDLFKSERRDLEHLMKTHPAEIINAQWSYEFAWAALNSGCPSVVTVRDHATTILKYQPSPYRLMRWFMNRIVLGKAKHLFTNSEYLRDLLGKKQAPKISVVHNFYKPELEKYYKTSEKKENYIISIANGFGYDKRKNVEMALHAFAILRKKYPNLKYYLLGQGTQREETAGTYRYAKKHNLLDGLELLGRRPFEEVLDLIKSARVLLHPSREESFGNTMLEAMVVGTPVVAGKNSGNVPFLLKQGEVGLLCDVDSPESIAENVDKVLRDEALGKTLREKGYVYAKENFSKDSIISKLIKNYQNILRQ